MFWSPNSPLYPQQRSKATIAQPDMDERASHGAQSITASQEDGVNARVNVTMLQRLNSCFLWHAQSTQKGKNVTCTTALEVSCSDSAALYFSDRSLISSRTLHTSRAQHKM